MWLICAFLKEGVPSLSMLQDVKGWLSKHLHDECELLFLTFAWEYGDAGIELNQDTAETPHINAGRVWNSSDDLWRSVESRLDVRVDLLVGEARRPKVNDLDA